MVKSIIEYSLKNRWLIIAASAVLFVWGLLAVRNNPVDAIPDLSENQVIVYTEWMGRSPQIIEDQVTYPLVTNLQGIPSVRNIRGTSMFGMSFVYVIFEDDVDIYWARTRVLERLNYAQKLLPEGISPAMGPDGTGVGHIFWYTLDAPGFDLGELRALQDWYVKFALQNVQGVSEVASFGGFQKQYQINIHPDKLAYYDIPLMDVLKAVRANNNDVGGRKIELNDIGYIIRSQGYMKDIEDIKKIALKTRDNIPVTMNDIATVQMGGELRLGIFDENGQGEVVGGVIVSRYGTNAEEVINNVKTKIREVEKGLPHGVRFKVAYDRNDLIQSAIATLKDALVEEMVIVALVLFLLLLHVRSALVVIITIPASVLIGFIFMNIFGVTSNIMSLAGIALAIGDLVDAGIVMVENAFRSISDVNDEEE